MAVTYTLSQIAEATGAKPRTLQFWTQNGVLCPIEDTMHGGSGRHRRYAKEEVELAAVIHEINAFAPSVGILRTIASYMRNGLTAGDRFGFTSSKEAREAAKIATLRHYSETDENQRHREILAELVKKDQGIPLSMDDAKDLEFWSDWTSAREGAPLWMSLNFGDDGSWRSGFAKEPNYIWTSEKGKDVWHRLVAIDVAAVLKKLWG